MKRLFGGKLAKRRYKRTWRSKAHLSRLRFEPLEGRCLLAVFLVTNLDDAPVAMAGDAPGTLRQAILDANELSGPDSVEFQDGLAGTLLLENGELPIEDSLTIEGPGQDKLIIDAQGTSRIISIDAQSIDVEISGMTLTGGFAQSGGAMSLSVRGESLMRIRDVTLDDNQAISGGGGIHVFLESASDNAPLMFIERATITNNRVRDGGGGGIYYTHSNPMSDGLPELRVVDSTITGNVADYGGGMRAYGYYGYTRSGELAVRSSVVSNNTGPLHGGGMSLAHGQHEISDSVVSHNSGGGIGVGYGDSVSVTRSTIAGNTGGPGIVAGKLTLRSSTVFGNVSERFGSGFVAEYAAIVNSTISGNVGRGGGGDYLTVRHSTVTGNSAGGLLSAYMIDIDHSIIAGNTAEGDDDIPNGIDVSNSLIGVGGSHLAGKDGNIVGTPEAPIDPMLGPLADNGGPTMTHALLPGSPAIDMGDPNAVVGVDDFPEFDQRGEAFARIADGDGDGLARIDIGAFELQIAPLTGDYNGNGRVEQQDLDLVLMHWGQSFDMLSDTWTTQRPASGIVDQAELDAVLLNWGASAPEAPPHALEDTPEAAFRANRSAQLDTVRGKLRPSRRSSLSAVDVSEDVIQHGFGQPTDERVGSAWRPLADRESALRSGKR